MAFFRWLKSLFSKSASQPSNPITEKKPITSKGWQVEWTEVLKKNLSDCLESLNTASDIERIYPGYLNLKRDDQILVWCEFFKALAYYESGYNPLSESVDVGTKDNKESWSVGLLQLSGVDKKNHGLAIGYDYERLKIPEFNLIQGLALMVNQVQKRGKIFIPNNEKGNPKAYWATLRPGNMYDKTEKILAAARSTVLVKKEAEILPENPISKDSLPANPVSNDFTPWMTIAEAEIGVSESKNPKRVIEYHQATDLKAKDTHTAWCSSFACWVLEQAGFKTTKSAWARNWLKYGDIADTQEGCIMVFERGTAGGTSHVGFYTGKQTATQYEVLGGNQGDSVCLKMYSKKDLLGCRWPVR